MYRNATIAALHEWAKLISSFKADYTVSDGSSVIHIHWGTFRKFSITDHNYPLVSKMDSIKIEVQLRRNKVIGEKVREGAESTLYFI